MFMQVIKGEVADASQARAAFDKWLQNLASGATGWLGSTSGVTEDGTLIMLARFDTEENARHNSDRPEQGEWWAETAKLFKGEPTFQDSTDVDVELVGDPDQAGFVQVMQGQVSDPDRARELMAQSPDNMRDLRPDILGSVSAAHDGGRWTMAVYFTSEEAAREAEAKEPSPEAAAMMEQMQALSVGETVFYDLKQPWLESPK